MHQSLCCDRLKRVLNTVNDLTEDDAPGWCASIKRRLTSCVGAETLDLVISNVLVRIVTLWCGGIGLFATLSLVHMHLRKL